MKKSILILLSICFCQMALCQNDTLYIKYDKTIKISEYEDSNHHKTIEVSFPILSLKDNIVTTYNFKINKFSPNFDSLEFDEINDSIDVRAINQKTLNELSKFEACDLYFLLADNKNIYLIKRKNNTHYKYKLTYWSTQRGWDFSNF